METLAERIAARRKELGLYQADLADAAGVSTAAVSQWERGETKNLKLEHLFAIADTLKVHARWLALGQGPRFMKAAMILLCCGALLTPSPADASFNNTSITAHYFAKYLTVIHIVTHWLQSIPSRLVRFLTGKNHGSSSRLIPT